MRSLAIFLADQKRQFWGDLTDAGRKEHLDTARRQIEIWVATGVLARFQYPYRTKEDDQRAEALGSPRSRR